MGWEGRHFLAGPEAADWARVQQQVARGEASARLPGRRRAGAHRVPLGEVTLEGRTLFRRAQAVVGVWGAQGQWHAAGEGLEEELWRGREAIWATPPPLPPTAERILDAYVEGRPRLQVEAAPAPRAGLLAALVLRGKGSAAGVDGHPYAVYHHGVAYVTALLAQAAHGAAAGEQSLDHCLGGSVYLLVWIPEAPPRGQGSTGTPPAAPHHLEETVRSICR